MTTSSHKVYRQTQNRRQKIRHACKFGKKMVIQFDADIE